MVGRGSRRWRTGVQGRGADEWKQEDIGTSDLINEEAEGTRKERA